MTDIPGEAPRRRVTSFLTHPGFRSVVIQVLLVAGVAWLGWSFFENARQNLAAQNIATGFGFFDQVAGFGISQSLIPYAETSTYGRAFLVGLLNTLLVSGLGIIFATILGFAIGIARLSSNVLLSRLAESYLEVVRNLPLLFQILFWYLAVLGTLPGPREATSVLGVYFSNRGILMPRLVFDAGSGLVVATLLIAIALAVALGLWARQRFLETGKPFPWRRYAVLLAIAPPVAAYFLAGSPISVELPELRGFNFVGGLRVNPELLALLIALSTYTAAFISEVVRAGFQGVPRGQIEAAYAVGLRRGAVLRLVVAPQAMRLLVPPLTNQYLNLTKNSTLAAAIGYPDFFYVFAGTTLNQTGQAIEIVAITMAVYLSISLVTALLMNWYNRAVALRGT